MFDQLTKQTQDRILNTGQRSNYAVDDFLIHDGDKSNKVFFVLDGLLKVIKSSVHGRISFVALRGRGSVVGELGVLSPSPRSGSIQAVSPTAVTQLSDAEFQTLLKDCPDLCSVLLEDLASRLQEATDQIHDLMSADAVTRLAGRLVRLAGSSRTGSPGSPTSLGLDLPISQQEVGEWAGLSRAATAKALGQLRHEGLIDTGRMSMQINDLARLVAIASEDTYAAI